MPILAKCSATAVSLVLWAPVLLISGCETSASPPLWDASPSEGSAADVEPNPPEASPGADGGFDDVTTFDSAGPGGGDSGGSVSEAGAPSGGDANAAAPCGAAGVLVCDDFEEPALAAIWMPLINHSQDSVAIDASRARTGKQSLHVRVDGNGGQAMIQETSTFPMAMNTIWGRAYFYLGAPTSMQHLTMIIASGSMPFDAADRFGMDQNLWTMNFVSSQLGGGEMSASSSITVMPNAWLCMEWNFAGNTGSYKEYLNGAPLAGADGTGQAVPTFENLSIGMETYGGDPATYDLWIDALAIGTQRIPCLP